MNASTIDLNDNITIRKIFFSNTTTGYVCGGKTSESGAIYKTYDGGQSWQKVYTNNQYCINCVYFLNDTLGYACGDNLLLLKTTNAGSTWNEYVYPELPINRFIVPLRDIYFVDVNKGYILGGDTYENGIVLRTYDGGNFWIYYGFNNELRSAYFPDLNNGIVSGYGGMFFTTDGGINYQPITVEGDFFISLAFTDNSTGYAAGYNGGIYKTTDAGVNWQQVFDGSKFLKKKMHFNAIQFIDSNKGYAIGNDGLILFTENGGNKWQQIKKVTDKNLHSLWVNIPGKILITSEEGKIFELNP